MGESREYVPIDPVQPDRVAAPQDVGHIPQGHHPREQPVPQGARH